MNRTIGGLPLIYWIAGLGLGVGAFVWIRKRSAASGGATSGATAKPAGVAPFSQAQEVQDFQIFSALTGAQQASDLNFVSEVAGLFAGGQSTGTTGGGTGGGGGTGTSSVPSPPSNGGIPPNTAQTGGPVNWQLLQALGKAGLSEAQINQLGGAEQQAQQSGAPLVAY